MLSRLFLVPMASVNWATYSEPIEMIHSDQKSYYKLNNSNKSGKFGTRHSKYVQGGIPILRTQTAPRNLI